ncbi:hypothetical protein [Micromonospora sp. WMMD712]|uniref:effector-associated constant component EACC1 n=1 Tax=Micromonospora sp. WMMD712 TaxID=3016096 RepID=UPI00249AAEA3|nr:hypothetical protein [Micromonospora sp. WMMD712]WFE59212.1 hypothetical protein O7633_21285 [Micromonospora sp. WMMD712]
MRPTVEIIGSLDLLLDLERELRADVDLRGTRFVRVYAPPQPEQMGPAVEALQWITENNELLAALTGAVAGWLARQRTPSRIKVKSGDVEIELESDKIKDPEAVAADMARRLSGQVNG